MADTARRGGAREKFPTRKILLRSETQRATALAALANAPLDPDRPIEFLLREEVKSRKPDQNAAMWAGPLKDIEEQAYVHGRTYSRQVWHEYFKEKFLPEHFDPELCKEGYRKWDAMPDGRFILVGSTTQLTVKGFRDYLRQVEAYAATELGVVFTASPREMAA